MTTLTAEDKSKLSNALEMLNSKLKPGATPGPLSKTDFRTIFAQILEQIGPLLLQLLITFLTEADNENT